MNRFRKFFGDPLTDEEQRITERIGQYSWYHSIEVAPGIFTPAVLPQFQAIWDFIEGALASVDFSGQRVLDIGCRDGKFSFLAERAGATEVLGIDNDLSPGAVEWLIPHFASKVKMERLNLYDLDPARHGQRGVILFFGVLYHLRYPFWGLRKILDCLTPGGILCIESGMFFDTAATRDLELMVCPVHNSPYEATSCTFFNAKGLITTLQSFGLELLDHRSFDDGLCPSQDGAFQANRQFFRLKKNVETAASRHFVNQYWDDTHAWHSVEHRGPHATARAHHIVDGASRIGRDLDSASPRRDGSRPARGNR